MPLEDGLVIECTSGTVELTVNLVSAHLDSKEELMSALAERVGEHQYQIMSDADLLDVDSQTVASVIVSRTALPPEAKEALLSLGFESQASESGGRSTPFWGIMSASKRGQLDRWRLQYQRAVDRSPTLGEFEDYLIENIPAGSLYETYEEAAQVTIQAARSTLRLPLDYSLESIRQLENRLLEAAGVGSYWVLHPSAVKGIAALLSQTVRMVIPRAHIDPSDEEGPLHIPSEHDLPIATDPEYRVIQMVKRGRRASITTYLHELLEDARN